MNEIFKFDGNLTFQTGLMIIITQLRICQVFFGQESKHTFVIITTCFAYRENTQNTSFKDSGDLQLSVNGRTFVT